MSSYLSSYDKGRYGSTTLSSTYKPSRNSYSSGSYSSSSKSSSYTPRSTSTYSSSSSSYTSNRFTSTSSSINSTRSSNRKEQLPDASVPLTTTTMPTNPMLSTTQAINNERPSLEEETNKIVDQKQWTEIDKQKLNHCIKCFDVLCVLLQNYANQVIPKLYLEIEKVKCKLNDVQMNYDKEILRNDNLRKEMDLMTDNHAMFLDNLNENHETELQKLENLLTQKFQHNLREQNLIHETEKTNLEKEFQHKEEKLQERFEEELNLKCSKIKNDNVRQVEELNKSHKIELEELRNLLDLKLNNPEDILLKKEIDSLRTVLEMKNTEIHELRSQLRIQENQLEQVPLLVTKLAVVEQKNAELKEALELKKVAEKRLSQRHVELAHLLEKEKLKAKRVSMDNEQLQYRLKNSLILDSDVHNLPMKRHWSEEFNDNSEPNSPSLIQIYTENSLHNGATDENSSKDIPVTVYTNDGEHKVFVFDKNECNNVESTVTNGHCNGSSISLQKEKSKMTNFAERNGFTDVDAVFIQENDMYHDNDGDD